MGYKLLQIVEFILMHLPKNLRKAFFTFLAFLAYHLSPKYRKIVKNNLDFAFDNKMSSREIEQITKYTFKNLLYNFLHLMEIRHMKEDELKSKITIINKEAVDRVHKDNRAVIYATSHYCAWELGAASMSLLIEPIAAVYKKMKNSTYEAWLLESRAKFGNTNLEKNKVIKPLIRLIKNKKASGILIDIQMKAQW